MILYIYVYNMQKNEDSVQNIHAEKNHPDATTFNSTMFNCRFEMSPDKLQNVSQSVNVSSLETVHLTTVKCSIKVPKVSSGTCQQFAEDAVKISNTFGFSTFTR